MSLAELRSVLSGQQGSNVTLTLVRARRAEPVKLTVTRDTVNPPAESDKMLEDGIGYIKTDDSFGNILADGLDEVAEWIQRRSQRPQ